MFILLVGLLGVGALIPVGRLEVSLADRYDRASAVGRAAFRELKVRGLLRPDAGCLAQDTSNGNAGVPVSMWLNYNGYTGAGTITPVGSGTVPVAEVTPVGGGSTTYEVVGEGLPVTVGIVTAPVAYCLDPWGLALNATSGFTTPYVGTFPANIESVQLSTSFPYAPSAAPSKLQYMTRITARALPSVSSPALGLAMSEHIFHAEDDLSVVVPGSNSGAGVVLGGSGNLSAIQQFFPSGNVQKRLSDGNYSWMATIVPNSPTLAYSTTAEPLNNQQYTVSVVVYYKRPVALNTPVNQAGQTTFYPERYATVTSFGGVAAPVTAVSGGEVTLQAPTPPSGGSSYDTTYLNVKRGQWILLAGQSNVYLDPTYGLSPPAAGSYPPVWIYRWYRVVAADDVQAATGSVNSTRNVTLVGPDWPAHAVANGGGTTFAIICDGVVGVYEKVMPLERTSVWSQQ